VRFETSRTALVLSILATDADALREVAGEVHDWWFDVDDVTFARGEVVIPFRRYEREHVRRRSALEREAPWHRWYLRIGEATSCELVDDAQVGAADLNDLEYDLAGGTLTVECSIPVTITVGVRTLSVALEETAEVLGLARWRAHGWMDGIVHPLS
jgi:hypothetical protein